MPNQDTVKSVTVPPPIGGLNYTQPISRMDTNYALELENCVVGQGTIDSRKGSRLFSTGVGASGSVVSLLSFYNTGGGDTLVAKSSSGTLWNCSSGTIGGAAATQITGTALTPDTMRWAEFRGNLFFTDRVVGVCSWDGIAGSYSAVAFIGPGGSDTNLGTIGVYNNRLYFVQRDAPIIWYGDVDAVTGDLKSFDLTSILKRFVFGQDIVFIGSTTRSKDVAEENLFCIVTKSGEILLYSGDYPASATWLLIGQYSIPKPLTQNSDSSNNQSSFFYLGNALYISTVMGLIALRDVMSGGSGIFPSLSKNVDPFLKTDATVGGGAPSLRYIAKFQSQNLIIMSYFNQTPLGIKTYKQFVLNLSQNNAWTSWSNLISLNFVEFDNTLIFAHLTLNKLYIYSGTYDEDPANNGSTIAHTFKIRHSYNYFVPQYQQESRQASEVHIVKQFTEARPIVYQTQGLGLTLDVDVDYANTTPTNTVTDSTTMANTLYRPRMGLKGIGKCASIHIEQSITDSAISLQGVEVSWNEGGTV